MSPAGNRRKRSRRSEKSESDQAASGNKRNQSTAKPKRSSKDAIHADLGTWRDHWVKYGAWILCAFLLLYMLWFLAEPILGGDEPITRILLIQNLVEAFPQQYLLGWTDDSFSFDVIRQRAIVFVPAVLVTLVAWAIGRMVIASLSMCAWFGRLERLVFSLAIGLQVHSLLIVTIGIAGWLHRVALVAGYAVTIGGLAAFLFVRHRRATRTCEIDTSPADQSLEPETPSRIQSVLSRFAISISALCAFGIILGAALPPTEFDVLEYHLQVPKEWFQQGEVRALPHNVYGNMPLGAESHSMACMALSFGTPAWWWGALSGKVVMSVYTLATALLLVSAGRRFRLGSLGTVSAAIYLSTPWVFKAANEGWNENAFGFYLATVVYLILFGIQQSTRQPSVGEEKECLARRSMFKLLAIAGWCAGSAVSIKYPAILFVVVPVASLLLFLPLLVRSTFVERALIGAIDFRAVKSFAESAGWRACVVFLVVCGMSCGLWFAKNLIWLGNPTYPLLGGLFGGRTVVQADQWVEAHRVSEVDGFSPRRLAQDVKQTMLGSQWLSAAIFPLAGLALCVRREQTQVLGLLVLCGFAFGCWWLMTHRLDRFLVPIFPLLAWLSGFGIRALPNRSWDGIVACFLTIAFMINLAIIFAPIPLMGETRYLASYDKILEPSTPLDSVYAFLDENVESNQRALLVGHATPFEINASVMYATCFDPCWFEKLTSNQTAEQALANFQERKISHIFINWSEINRYRSPGNYGYSEYLQPSVVESLIEQNVLSAIDIETPPEYQLLRVRVP